MNFALSAPQGTASQPTVAGRDAIGSGSALLLGRCESVTLHDHPCAASLRKGWVWQDHPFSGADLERVAFHEAGHVVLLEWLNVTNVRAEASSLRGGVYILDTLPDADVTNSAADRADLAATAAAIFHAGTCAELLQGGAAWCGPILRLQQADHQKAEKIVRPTCGAHSSGAHAYAQRVALHVLSHRWWRVCEVAAALVRDGEWKPDGRAQH